jgi:hypothetical protein
MKPEVQHVDEDVDELLDASPRSPVCERASRKPVVSLSPSGASDDGGPV